MSRLSLYIFLIFSAGFVHAAGDKPSQIPGGGAADLLNNTKFNPDTAGAKKSGSSTKVKLTASCKDATGGTAYNADVGFDRCVADKQSSAGHASSPANSKPVPSLTIESGK